MTRLILAVVCWLGCAAALADDSAVAATGDVARPPVRVGICYNYGCFARAEVEFTPAELQVLDRMFAKVASAEDERRLIARAVGRMYFFAGRGTPIWHDHGMNYNDNGIDGMMDCIDHSSNTSEFLAVLRNRNLLRFHQLRSKLRRSTLFVADHWTARIVDSATGTEYAVDSWFGEPGEPAAVMTVSDWLKRKDPRG